MTQKNTFFLSKTIIFLVAFVLVAFTPHAHVYAADTYAYDTTGSNVWCTSTLNTTLNDPTAGYLRESNFTPAQAYYFARTNWTAGPPNNPESVLCFSRVSTFSYHDWDNPNIADVYRAAAPDVISSANFNSVWTRTPVESSTNEAYTVSTTDFDLEAQNVTDEAGVIAAVKPYGQLSIASGTGSNNDPYIIYNANPEMQFLLNNSDIGFVKNLTEDEASAIALSEWGVGDNTNENEATWLDKVSSISYSEWSDDTIRNQILTTASEAGETITPFWTRTVSETEGEAYAVSSVDSGSANLTSSSISNLSSYSFLPSLYLTQNACLQTDNDTDAGTINNPYSVTTDCYSLIVANNDNNQMSNSGKTAVVYGTFSDISGVNVGQPFYIAAKLGNDIAWAYVTLNSPAEQAPFVLEWVADEVTPGIYGGESNPLTIYATTTVEPIDDNSACDPTISFDNCQPVLTDPDLVATSSYTGQITMTDGYLTGAELLELNNLAYLTKVRFAGSIYFNEDTHPGIRNINGSAVSAASDILAADYYCYSHTGCQHLDPNVAVENYNQAGDYQIWYKTIAGVEYPFLIQFFGTPTVDGTEVSVPIGQSTTITVPTFVEGQTCAWTPTTNLDDPNSCTVVITPTAVGATEYTVEISTGNSLDYTVVATPHTFAEFDADYCNYMSQYDTVTLTDTRDNKTYRVRKMPDGNCWMIDNLAYGGSTATGGTDACATKTEYNGYGSADYSNIFGANTYGDCRNPAVGTCTITATDPSNTDPYNTNCLCQDGSTNCGYLYNWQAVMQHSSAYQTTEGVAYDGPQGINTVKGLCPDGEWYVPTGGPSGQFATLDIAFGGTGARCGNADPTQCPSLGRWTGNDEDDWAGTYSGYVYSSGVIAYQGRSGGWWSSTPSSTLTQAYYLDFNSTSVSPQYSGIRNPGRSVRCVLSPST